MKTIIVKTQAEMDAIPADIKDTRIEIRSISNIWIKVNLAYGSSRVVAYGSSSVEAYDSSGVEANDSSRVVAYGSSRVVAYDSSRVEAYGSSSVVAYGSSSVEANDSSGVVANDSSRVEAYGSSSVEAYGSSSVVAYGSSRVVAYGSSRVEAYDSSRVEAYDSSRVEAYNSSRVVANGSSCVVVYGFSSVVANGSSSVVANGSSRVVAYGSSRVVAYGSSSVVANDSSGVEANDSSSVEAYGSSSVVAYGFSILTVFAASVIIKHIADRTVTTLRGVLPRIEKKDKTAKVIKLPCDLDVSFDTWLKRGFVVADGIRQRLVSKKKKGSIQIFTTETFLDKKKSYVVKKGDLFSHGDTVEKAIEGLRYKLSSRDTSKFKRWTFTKKITQEEAIQAYRAITGACEYGVRSFVESKKIPASLTVKKVIELTKGYYGHDKFSSFAWSGK